MPRLAMAGFIMKAVFLDWATMGPGLDTSRLHAVLPELEVFDATAARDVATRIDGAEFVLANKIRLSDELLSHAPTLRFIGLTATGTDNVDLADRGTSQRRRVQYPRVLHAVGRRTCIWLPAAFHSQPRSLRGGRAPRRMAESRRISAC